METPHNPLPKILIRVVPAIFGCVGVTVIVFLWSRSAGALDSPPLFFKIFGSLIGLAFVVIGFGTAIFGPAASPNRLRQRIRGGAGEAPPRSGGSYDCPNCGSGLDSDADVSPSGDVKCSFCDRWFNIHQGGA